MSDLLPIVTANLLDRPAIIFSTREGNHVQKVSLNGANVENYTNPLRYCYIAIPGVEHYDYCIPIPLKAAAVESTVEDQAGCCNTELDGKKGRSSSDLKISGCRFHCHDNIPYGRFRFTFICCFTLRSTQPGSYCDG